MILSKDAGSDIEMDSRTKKLVRKVFGENFAGALETYQQQISDLKDEVEASEGELASRGNLLLRVSDVLEHEGNLPQNLIDLRAKLAVQRKRLEGGVGPTDQVHVEPEPSLYVL
jgi:hypothetical protein